MEAYETEPTLLTYPPVTDNSLEMRQMVHYFSRAYRNHCSAVCNRYLFSWDNDFLTIVPIRTQYRVIGRTDKFAPVKTAKYFDTYFTGSLEECICRMQDMVSHYVLIV